MEIIRQSGKVINYLICQRGVLGSAPSVWNEREKCKENVL